MSFFQSFMMPVLNILLLIGMIVFYITEKISTTKLESRRKAISIRNIRMIYVVSLLGYLLAQPLSLGNARLVLQYYKNLTVDNASRLVMSILDYTTLFVLMVMSICVLFYFSRARTFKRVIIRLVSKETSEMIEKKKTQPNLYQLTNPVFKARRGFYDDIMKVDFGGGTSGRTSTLSSGQESDRVPL